MFLETHNANMLHQLYQFALQWPCFLISQVCYGNKFNWSDKFWSLATYIYILNTLLRKVAGQGMKGRQRAKYDPCLRQQDGAKTGKAP